MTARIAWRGILPLLALLAVPQLGAGQLPPGPRRQQMEQQLRNRFNVMVRQRIGLSSEGEVRFNEVLRAFQGRRQELVRRENQLRRRLRAEGQLAPPAAGIPMLTDDEARELLDEMSAIQEAEHALFNEEQAALLEFLSPGQLLRFYAMRDNLGERIRQLGRGGGGPGRGPVGPGWGG